MSLSPSMVEIDEALRDWVRAATGVTGKRVIAEDQMPNPPKPVNLRETSFVTVGEAVSHETGLPRHWRDSEGVQMNYVARYDLSFYGKGARGLARLFQVNAWREDLLRDLLAHGVMLLRTGDSTRMGQADMQSGGGERLPDIAIEVEVTYEQVDDGSAAQETFDEDSYLTLTVEIDTLE